MGYKIIGGTQANWIISVVDGFYRISDTLKKYVETDFENKFVILWAWQTQSGIEKIQNEALGAELYFMTDKSKAEIIGTGRWIKAIGNYDLSSYWKDQPQWNKKWEYPYLLEVTHLNKRFDEKIRSLSTSERLLIVNNKEIKKRKIFFDPELEKIPNAKGGAFWETNDAQQNSAIERGKSDFVLVTSLNAVIKTNFWWVCQGESYTEDRGFKYLWAPHKDRSGSTPYHWKNVKLVKKGDIIFNYANGAIQGVSIAKEVGYNFENDQSKWEKEGTRVDIEHFKLESIPLSKIELKTQVFKETLKDISGPFDINGDVKQGYLFEFNFDAAKVIRDIYGKPFPEPIEKLFTQEKTMMTVSSNIKHIHKFILSKGFQYGLKDIANFYLSLKTKPFVILAGISGTGKTQLVRKFAEAINAKCELIPVKPDWTDNSDLIGFKNLEGIFQEKELLRIIKIATQNPEKIYFALLDEMNLARVEHYFSDFLSLIETREIIDGKIVTERILDEADLGDRVDLVNLHFPENFYLIGTVNMDETTHPFSRKVLDRANSIELSEVYLNWSGKSESFPPIGGVDNSFLKARYIRSIDLDQGEKDTLKEVLQKLIEINDILRFADLQFGYRVRDEICFYMLYRKEIEDIVSFNEALDYQIMQKILPRIQGSSIRIKRLIVDLIKYLSNTKSISDHYNYPEIENEVKGVENFRKSLNKLLFMFRRCEDEGFTSFWL